MHTYTIVGFGTAVHAYHEVRASNANEALGLATRMYAVDVLRTITWQVFLGLPLVDSDYCMKHTRHLPI